MSFSSYQISQALNSNMVWTKLEGYNQLEGVFFWGSMDTDYICFFLVRRLCVLIVICVNLFAMLNADIQIYCCLIYLCNARA